MKPSDEQWMLRAFRLAERGRVGTSPNPMVGACVVKNGKLIAEGWHRVFGEDHAEAAALKRAGRRARGATLYVTLEPCSTYGKTPPCVDAVIKSGIRRVVVGIRDPNPRHNGRGLRRLREKGIRVRSGLLKPQLYAQNAAFLKYMKTGLPYVTLKMAQSLDGKIATRTGKSKWITSAVARRWVQQLRLEQDAVLVGQNTARADNPSLSARTARKHPDARKPWRIVLDARGRLPHRRKVFRGPQLTLVAVAEKQAFSGHDPGTGKRVIIPVPEKNGALELGKLLKKLAGMGVSKLLVEGGGETGWSLLSQGLVDKVCWMVAPKIIGGRDAVTSVEGLGVKSPAQALRCKNVHVRKLGADWLFEGEVAK